MASLYSVEVYHNKSQRPAIDVCENPMAWKPDSNENEENIYVHHSGH